MIKVIGSVNCIKCEMAKNKLEEAGVEFDYRNIENFPDDVIRQYTEMAEKAGKKHLPIIVKDGEITTVEKVIKTYKIEGTESGRITMSNNVSMEKVDKEGDN